MLRKVALSITALSLASLPSLAVGQTSQWVDGRIIQMWADPDATVISYGIIGPCGGDLFTISKNNSNFQEFIALLLTAASAGKSVSLHVAGCSGERNVVSHGTVKF